MKIILAVFAAILLVSPLQASIMNCQRSSWYSGVERCDQCYSGYYPFNQGESCVACKSGCAACLNFNTCTSCSSGYYLNEGTCSACPTRCASCTSSSSCQTCKTDNYMQNGVCYSCVYGCQSCNDGVSCVYCKTGFYKNNGTTCSSCLSNCESCNAPNQCTVCKGGYKHARENGVDRCDDAIGPFLMIFLLIIAAVVLVPCIICCICWAAVAKCLGIGQSTHTQIQIHEHNSPYNAYHQAPDNVYQPAFPQQPGQGIPPIYTNRGNAY